MIADEELRERAAAVAERVGMDGFADVIEQVTAELRAVRNEMARQCVGILDGQYGLPGSRRASDEIRRRCPQAFET